MIIRGICCLVPAVPELTENITVISVVGRFLEHSRIYRFGVGEEEKVYISSADFMTRNTLRRVEVAVPIYDLAIKKQICHIFDTVFGGRRQGKDATRNREYIDRMLGEKKLDAQEVLYEEAYRGDQSRRTGKRGGNRMIPQDPVILLSYVNTKLRDQYSSLEQMCHDMGVNQREIEQKLAGMDYAYDSARNQFV